MGEYLINEPLKHYVFLIDISNYLPPQNEQDF